MDFTTKIRFQKNVLDKKHDIWPKKSIFGQKIDFFGQKIDFLCHSGLSCELGPIEVAEALKIVSDELESSLKDHSNERHELFNLVLHMTFYTTNNTLADFFTPPLDCIKIIRVWLFGPLLTNFS